MGRFLYPSLYIIWSMFFYPSQYTIHIMPWKTNFAICPQDYKNFDKYAEYFVDEAEAEISAMELSVTLCGARIMLYKRTRSNKWKEHDVIFA